MGKMGDKLLSFIGLEPTDEEVDDRYYDEQDDLQDDMMGFPEDDFAPPVEEKKTKKRGETAKVIGIPDTSKVRVLIYKPVSYEDTQSIIDHLKEKKPIIVNLELLEVDIAQRVLDFMSGAVYALNGSIHKVSKGIFVLAPINVDISGNIPEENKGRSNSSFFSLANKREG